MSVTVLEEAIERLGTVPLELRRLLEFVKVIDNKWRHGMEELRKRQKEYIVHVQESVKGQPRDGSVDLLSISKDPKAYNEIIAMRKLVMGLAEEKVAAANQAFDLLDNHLRKTEGDIMAAADALRKAGQEVPMVPGVDDYDGYEDPRARKGKSHNKRVGGGFDAPVFSPPAAAPLGRQGSTAQFSVGATEPFAGGIPAAPPTVAAGREFSSISADAFGGTYPAASPSATTYGGFAPAAVPPPQQRQMSTQSVVPLPPHMGASGIGGLAGGYAAVDDHAEAAGDGEKYCICDKPGYGEMVGCDNPTCEKEWFHLECVGLRAAPQGKWFCPLCRKKEVKLPPPKRR